jgi:hypothetical protein
MYHEYGGTSTSHKEAMHVQEGNNKQYSHHMEKKVKELLVVATTF